MTDRLKTYTEKLEALAREMGVDYYPVVFEKVPPTFMMEVAVYGLPVRMPHWSFGVRYIYQLIQHRMGGSRIFEVVFPGNPGRAYLASTNSVEENTLVVAHVLGHADFAKNNLLFRSSQEQVGLHIVEQAARHAQRITEAIEAHGEARVEAVLDAALALEQHIDFHRGLRRERFPEYMPRETPAAETEDAFRARYRALEEEATPAEGGPRQRAPLPPAPEHDLLWFVAEYAPDMEDWERDIFLAVREESFYFYPVFACQTMNEGWASYWHATLLREADFLPQSLYVEAVRTHSDVVRPFAGEGQAAVSLNPYHLGYSMWDRIIEQEGMDKARAIREEEDDFGFIRNYLSEEMAAELDLFRYTVAEDGRVTVAENDIDVLRETLLAHKFNFGAPRIAAEELQSDGTLVLRHAHEVDGRGLDLSRGRRVLEYLSRVWRRPVVLHTVNGDDEPEVLVQEPA